MGLTKCQECGGTLSTKAPACPRCGAPGSVAVPKGPHASAARMKDAGLVIIVLGMIAFFIGVLGAGGSDEKGNPFEVVAVSGGLLFLIGLLIFALSGAGKPN